MAARDLLYIDCNIQRGEIAMEEQRMRTKNIKKIFAYIFFVIVTFVISLLYLPYELFLLSTIVVFIALRGVEKELGILDFKKFKALDVQPTKTKV